MSISVFYTVIFFDKLDVYRSSKKYIYENVKSNCRYYRHKQGIDFNIGNCSKHNMTHDNNMTYPHISRAERVASEAVNRLTLQSQLVLM